MQTCPFPVVSSPSRVFFLTLLKVLSSYYFVSIPQALVDSLPPSSVSPGCVQSLSEMLMTHTTSSFLGTPRYCVSVLEAPLWHDLFSWRLHWPTSQYSLPSAGVGLFGSCCSPCWHAAAILVKYVKRGRTLYCRVRADTSQIYLLGDKDDIFKNVTEVWSGEQKHTCCQTHIFPPSYPHACLLSFITLS